MNISECFDFLNFWINKTTGAWYTISELTQLVDNGSMALYTDYQPKASTSQRIKDALAPFKDTYNITPANSLSGIVTVPSDRNYLNLLDIEIRYAISGVGKTVHVPIQVYNEDTRAERLNSQVDPVTVTSPIGEQLGKGQWQLYPQVQYFGSVAFYKRPTKPVFAYTVISGRVIVYDPTNSVQLNWNETQHTELLIKALESIGINLKDSDLAQWSEMKSQMNYQNVNRI